MVDREKVVAVLKKRFAGAGVDQIAAAANAIVGLEDEWEEVTAHGDNMWSPRAPPPAAPAAGRRNP